MRLKLFFTLHSSLFTLILYFAFEETGTRGVVGVGEGIAREVVICSGESGETEEEVAEIVGHEGTRGYLLETLPHLGMVATIGGGSPHEEGDFVLAAHSGGIRGGGVIATVDFLTEVIDFLTMVGEIDDEGVLRGIAVREEMDDVIVVACGVVVVGEGLTLFLGEIGA